MFSKGEQSSQKRHTSEQSPQDLDSIQEGERSNEKAKRKDKAVLKKAIETKNLVPDYNSIIKMQESPFFGEKNKAIDLSQGSPFQA